MEANLLLEQYKRYKLPALENSPYKCLLNADIELNPHQINAFCAAIQALKTGGIILADEVGLGKTIEAALVLNYVIDSGAKKIMIVLPATLRKQWEEELDEKFHQKARILDRPTVEKEAWRIKSWLNSDKVSIVIASYDYSSKLMKRFPDVKWDFLIIDEAHNLRNVFHGTKRAKRLYDLTEGIPKILLTATPLQNSLSDLHGLVSYIDPRIFGSEKLFNRKFIEGEDYRELKEELHPVLYRTLRKDVGKYMNFSKRECRTVNFHLTREEQHLYNLVNDFLKRDPLYSIPTGNRGLIILVIRKLLASSSFALVDTFEVFKNRLEKLYEGTKSANAQDGFNLFWEFVEDEIDESDFDDKEEDDDVIEEKVQIQEELDIVQKIIDVASAIKTNAKMDALKIALEIAFKQQQEKEIPQKVVVFTESKRTQKFIASQLREDSYDEEDILLFNGDFDDSMTKDIYRAWQVKNFGKTNYGRSVEYKHAIVDYFKANAKILIVTDAGSEGLNLQFCNTVINYDLPWNPQKIEQRIGRCHRYGQKYDVVAINLLNTDNEADRRVYEILSHKFELFDGVFGASDVALGILESGTSFEKTILDIYQKCGTKAEFMREFKKLNLKLDSQLNEQVDQLRNILLTESPEAKGEALEKTKREIDQYLREFAYWTKIADSSMSSELAYWRIDDWGEENWGSHGTLFVGAFCDDNRALFPVLLLCDENGDYIDFDEEDIVRAVESAEDSKIHYFKPSDQELQRYEKIYIRLTQEMLEKYYNSVEPIKKYNQHKLENWARIQREQMEYDIAELQTEIDDLFSEESKAIDSLQKRDIFEKILKKRKKLDATRRNLRKKTSAVQREAQEEIKLFDESLEINPKLLVNVVLKF